MAKSYQELYDEMPSAPAPTMDELYDAMPSPTQEDMQAAPVQAPQQPSAPVQPQRKRAQRDDSDRIVVMPDGTHATRAVLQAEFNKLGRQAFNQKHGLSPDSTLFAGRSEVQAEAGRSQRIAARAKVIENRADIYTGVAEGMGRGATFGLWGPSQNTGINKLAGIGDAQGELHGDTGNKTARLISEITTGLAMIPLTGAVSAARAGTAIGAGMKATGALRTLSPLSRAGEAVSQINNPLARMGARAALGAGEGALASVPFSIGQNRERTGEYFGEGVGGDVLRNAVNPMTLGLGAVAQAGLGAIGDAAVSRASSRAVQQAERMMQREAVVNEIPGMLYGETVRQPEPVSAMGRQAMEQGGFAPGERAVAGGVTDRVADRAIGQPSVGNRNEFWQSFDAMIQAETPETERQLLQSAKLMAQKHNFTAPEIEKILVTERGTPPEIAMRIAGEFQDGGAMPYVRPQPARPVTDPSISNEMTARAQQQQITSGLASPDRIAIAQEKLTKHGFDAKRADLVDFFATMDAQIADEVNMRKANGLPIPFDLEQQHAGLTGQPIPTQPKPGQPLTGSYTHQRAEKLLGKRTRTEAPTAPPMSSPLSGVSVSKNAGGELGMRLRTPGGAPDTIAGPAGVADSATGFIGKQDSFTIGGKPQVAPAPGTAEPLTVATAGDSVASNLLPPDRVAQVKQMAEARGLIASEEVRSDGAWLVTRDQNGRLLDEQRMALTATAPASPAESLLPTDDVPITLSDAPTSSTPSPLWEQKTGFRAGLATTGQSLREHFQLLTAPLERYGDEVRVAAEKMSASRGFGDRLINQHVGAAEKLLSPDDQKLLLKYYFSRRQEKVFEALQAQGKTPTPLQVANAEAARLTPDELQYVTSSPKFTQARQEIGKLNNEMLPITKQLDDSFAPVDLAPEDYNHQIGISSYQEYVRAVRGGKEVMVSPNGAAALLDQAADDGIAATGLRDLVNKAPEKMLPARSFSRMLAQEGTTSGIEMEGGALAYVMDLRATAGKNVKHDLFEAAKADFLQETRAAGALSDTPVRGWRAVDVSTGRDNRLLAAYKAEHNIETDTEAVKQLLMRGAQSIDPQEQSKIATILSSRGRTTKTVYVPPKLESTYTKILRRMYGERDDYGALTTGLTTLTKSDLTLNVKEPIAHLVRLWNMASRVSHAGTPLGRVFEVAGDTLFPGMGRAVSQVAEVSRVTGKLKAGMMGDPEVVEFLATERFLAQHNRLRAKPLEDTIARASEGTSTTAKVINTGLDKLGKTLRTEKLTKAVFEGADPKMRTLYAVALKRMDPSITPREILDAVDNFGVYARELQGEKIFSAIKTGVVPFAGFRSGSYPGAVGNLLTGSAGYAGTPLAMRAQTIIPRVIAMFAIPYLVGKTMFGQSPTELGLKAYEIPIEVDGEIHGINTLAVLPSTEQAAKVFGIGQRALVQSPGKEGGAVQGIGNLSLRSIDSPALDRTMALGGMAPYMTMYNGSPGIYRKVKPDSESKQDKSQDMVANVATAIAELSPLLEAAALASFPELLNRDPEDRLEGVRNLVGLPETGDTVTESLPLPGIRYLAPARPERIPVPSENGRDF